MIHFSLINLCSGRKRGKYGQNYVLFSLQQGHFVPASVVEPVPGWNRLQTRKEPDLESPSSISRKEPNSYSGADSRPESLTPLVRTAINDHPFPMAPPLSSMERLTSIIWRNPESTRLGSEKRMRCAPQLTLNLSRPPSR